MASSTQAPMLKKRAREGWQCNNRHCPSSLDAQMKWYSKGQQRARERREWRKDQRG